MKSLRINRFILLAAIFLVFSSFMSAEDESKHQVAVQGTAFIGKQTSGNGITNNPTDSGGFVVSYRYNLNRRFSLEGDFDYFRSTMKYSGASPVANNNYAGTGALITKLPGSAYVKPFALVGAGGLVFSPRDHSPFDTQARATFVYGGGIDIPLHKHIALRTEYRGFVYKVPDFDSSSLKVDKFTHSVVPSVGFVYNF